MPVQSQIAAGHRDCERCSRFALMLQIHMRVLEPQPLRGDGVLAFVECLLRAEEHGCPDTPLASRAGLQPALLDSVQYPWPEMLIDGIENLDIQAQGSGVVC